MRAWALAVRIYEVLRDCREYRLNDQMTGSAISIAANIAEGAKRDSKRKHIRFRHIAEGFAAELRTQAYIGHRNGVLEQKPSQSLPTELKEISKILYGLAT